MLAKILEGFSKLCPKTGWLIEISNFNSFFRWHTWWTVFVLSCLCRILFVFPKCRFCQTRGDRFRLIWTGWLVGNRTFWSKDKTKADWRVERNVIKSYDTNEYSDKNAISLLWGPIKSNKTAFWESYKK
jgi:hypothetical protein